VPRGGELAHVQPDLGDEHLGGVAADPGDLVQAVHRRQERSQDLPGCGVDGLGVAQARDASLTGCGSAATQASGGWLCGGDRGDRLLDPGGELVDLAA
jgi:hypothetical protein